MSVRVLEAEAEIIGKVAVESSSGDFVGRVSGAMTSLREGLIAGITLQGREGVEWFCGAGNYLVQGEMVIIYDTGVMKNYCHARHSLKAPDRGEILGATVVGEDGRLLGSVSDVIEVSSNSHAIYQIRRSGLKRLLGDEVWLSNDYCIYYLQDRSRQGLRIIAPLEAVYPTFDEALCKNSSFAPAVQTTQKQDLAKLPLLLMLALTIAILLSFWPW